MKLKQEKIGQKLQKQNNNDSIYFASKLGQNRIGKLLSSNKTISKYDIIGGKM